LTSTHPTIVRQEVWRYIRIAELGLVSVTFLDIETLLQGSPHWTNEEVTAWLDWDKKKEEEVKRQVEAERITAGGFGESKERGIRGLMSRIGADIEANSIQYRFTN
jgi:hypothetical protein